VQTYSDGEEIEEMKKKDSNIVSNRRVADQDVSLCYACKKLNIPVTKRQASKWRRGKGIAYKKVVLKEDA
jgi:hypothetical protein